MPDQTRPPADANTCPHCGAAACLPLWRKLLLGPAASAPCRICGFRVAVEVVRAWLAMSPTLLLVLLAVLHLVTGPVALVLLLVLCLGATGGGYLFWVPLVPDELTSARMVEAARARRGTPHKGW
jgi:hypothetical protein